PVQHTGQTSSDTLFIHLYKSEPNIDLIWDYYEDDGLSYRYEDGDYYLRKMIYKPMINEVSFNQIEGNMDSKFKFIQLVFHGFGNMKTMINYNGKPMKSEYKGFDFQKAAEAPDANSISTIVCPTVTFPNRTNNIIINW
nr:DUF5110 domain-containing protein [Bacteroidota bacterium]